MSTVKVNKITPRTCNSIQLGESGDTLTIPSGATLQNCGTATGFGISFCTTVKTSPFTATGGRGFFINTGSAVTVTLPASPSAGDELIVIDSTGQAATNNITLGRNGSKIKGQCVDAKIKVNRGGARIVYSGCSQGWITATAGNETAPVLDQTLYVTATGGTETTSGDFKIHTFNSTSTFTVCTAPTPANNNVSYMVVAGGGGASENIGGGGGAGGFREGETPAAPYTGSPLKNSSGLPVSASTTYPVTVGAGGVGGAFACAANGADSVFSSITSAGGGKSGDSTGGGPVATGQAGGSGGGGASGTSGNPGGAGNTPPVSPPQGNSGGNGSGPGAFPQLGSGGGGGATASGVTGTTSASGNGGAGASSEISGSAVVRAGGGGGAGGYRFSDGTASGSYCAGPSPLGASALPVPAQIYPIVVGAGAAAQVCSGPPSGITNGIRGSDSSFSTITSTAGGGGKATPSGNPLAPGGSGGDGLVEFRFLRI